MQLAKTDKQLGETSFNHSESVKDKLRAIPNDVIETSFKLLSGLVIPAAKKPNIALCGTNIVNYGYVLACFKPDYDFYVFDNDTKVVDQAIKSKPIDNVSYIKDDLALLEAKDHYDAIINVKNLHQIYSKAQYNGSAIARYLARQVETLKEGGLLLIDDYIYGLGQDEWVKIQIPKSQEDFIDKLLWFADNARPLFPAGTRGFLIEEENSILPNKRSFRCQKKWISEFILRYDLENAWTSKLSSELSAFSFSEVEGVLKSLGFRCQFFDLNKDKVEQVLNTYSIKISEKDRPINQIDYGRGTLIFEKKSDGTILDYDLKSIKNTQIDSIQSYTVRHLKNDHVIECLKHTETMSYLLPYAYDSSGNLKVFLNSDKHTPNIFDIPYVPNEYTSLSDFGLSLLEVHSEKIEQAYTQEKAIQTIKFLKESFGLKPVLGKNIQKMPAHFFHEKFYDFAPNIYFIEIDQSQLEEKENFDYAVVRRALNQNMIKDVLIENALNILASKISYQGAGFDHLLNETDILQTSLDKGLILDAQTIEKRLAGDKVYRESRGKAHEVEKKALSYAGLGMMKGRYIGLSGKQLSICRHRQFANELHYIVPVCMDVSGEVFIGLCITDLPFLNMASNNQSQILSFPKFQIEENMRLKDKLQMMLPDHQMTLKSLVPSFYEFKDNLDLKSSAYLFSATDISFLGETCYFISIQALGQLPDTCFSHLSLMIKNRVLENLSEAGFKTSINALYQKKKKYKKSKR